MHRLTPLLLLVHTLILAGVVTAAPLHGVNASAIDAKKEDASKAGGRAKAPTPGGPGDRKALWWNDPAIARALSLTDEQRKKIGEYLKAYRKEVPGDRRAEAFHETLVQGDWKGARSENKKLAELAEQSVRLRGNLKVDVLSVLSKEQHGILVDKFPRLIYKPWIRAMRGTSPR